MYVNLDVTTLRTDEQGNQEVEEPAEHIEKVFLAKVSAAAWTACP
jgi:hypothetical protein